MLTSKRQKQIECLERYGGYTSHLEDIMEFLFTEKIISRDDIKLIKQSPDHSKELELLLTRLQSESKLQLLEYEWNLLPVERIKITIVTDNVNKEFTFNH